MSRIVSIRRRSSGPVATPASVTGAVAVGARLLGPSAMGPLALAVTAVGAIAVGRLAIANAVIRKLRAEEIEIGLAEGTRARGGRPALDGLYHLVNSDGRSAAVAVGAPTTNRP